jgi:carbon starvation protein
MKEMTDGVDFVATSRATLFGHHVSSSAAAASIIGTAIVFVLGWLPAVVRTVLGSFLMGAVHDSSVLLLSTRHRGESVGQITASVLGPCPNFSLVWVG